jgi:hypothetical protein
MDQAKFSDDGDEGAGVPGRDPGAGCRYDAMRERPQSGHIHAGHGDAGQNAELSRLSHCAMPKQDSAA